MSGGEKRSLYARLLDRWIAESGLNAKEIADRCTAAGQPITNSYIGKLRKGAVPPPKDEVSYALAKALGKEAFPLRFLGTLVSMNPEWQNIFWSLLSILLDPTRPVLDQLENYREIKGLPVLIEGFAEGKARMLDDEVDLDIAKFVVLNNVYRTMDRKLRTVSAPSVDGVDLRVFDQVPEQPIGEITWFESRGVFKVDARGAQDADYALRISGSAMTDIGAWPGDLLFIKQGREGLSSGNTVLIRVRGEVTARRYYEVPGSFRLEPALLAGAPINLDEVEILGIVRGLVRSM
jgi:SOS-response transcriptional repressor LexA